MSEIYKRFCDQTEFYDFSTESAESMFLHESTGSSIEEKLSNGKWNGYLVGKKWMDLTITEYWLPDLEEHKTLFAFELYQDFPHWFLIKVLPERWHLSEEDAESLYERKENSKC